MSIIKKHDIYCKQYNVYIIQKLVKLSLPHNGFGLGFKELLNIPPVVLLVETGDFIGSDVRLVSAACSFPSFSQMTKLLICNTF